MFARAICCLSVLAVANGFILDTFLGQPPAVVQQLDVSKYLGRWFQMYASTSVITLFESGAVCVTADYLLGSDGKITVLNSERLNTANGSLKVIHGFVKPSTETGKLTVNLEQINFDAPYWVLKLGPATYGSERKYQYAIVSDNVRGTLFVLARDPDVFRKSYDSEVQTFLNQNGFTHFYNKPVSTYHGDDCLYNADHQ